MTAVGVRGGLLTGLLPQEVMVVELFADPPAIELYPEEAAVVAKAVEKRRREFATVRICARAALAQLGVAPCAILPGAKREPQWPAGIVGSMTHCDGYRAAAVAHLGVVVSVGVDAEPHAPLPDGLEESVTLPEERRTLARLRTSHPDIAWDRLLFSAKESVFKAWFPLTGRWLDFSECVINPDPHLGTFTGILTVPGPRVAGQVIDRFIGRWRTQGASGTGHVATAVLVAPSAGWV